MLSNIALAARAPEIELQKAFNFEKY